MEVSTRAQNVALAALCAFAVGTSALAVWSVNRPHPSLGETAGTTTATAPATAPSSATQAPEETDDDTEATSEGPASVSAPAAAPDIGSWREAWADDGASLLVVGDGYANLPTQWVQLWGVEVGQQRPVEIHHWGEAQDVTFNDAITLSEGDGPALTIWSASRAGTSIAAAAERVDRFVEEAGDVDAVLVALGLGSEGEDVASSLDALLGEIGEDLPVLVSVGPTGLYEADVSEAMLGWAEDHADRVAVLDLRDAAPQTPNAEQWAISFARATGTG